MRFMLTPEEITAQTAELTRLKAEAAAKAGVKPSFFETTAGTITVGVVGAAVGIGGGYLLFANKEEPQAAKK